MEEKSLQVFVNFKLEAASKQVRQESIILRAASTKASKFVFTGGGAAKKTQKLLHRDIINTVPGFFY